MMFIFIILKVDFLVWGRTTYIKLLREQVPLKRMDKEIPTKYYPIPPKDTCLVT